MAKQNKNPVTKTKPLDPFEIFTDAESFSEAAVVLLKKLKLENHLNVVSPAVTCSSFAIELYLKCLLTIETGSAPWGHDLKALFNSLPIKYKLRATTKFNAEIAKSPSAIKVAKLHSFNNSLDDLLTHGALTFEKVRYLWQNQAKGVYALGPLIPILREIILELYPQWDADRKNPQNLPSLEIVLPEK